MAATEDQKAADDQRIENAVMLAGEQLQLPVPLPKFTPPTVGEVITSLTTNVNYTIGTLISDEGHFSSVYACDDGWGNKLVAKVLKPRGEGYEKIKQNAISEVNNLVLGRHPNITYIYDAFEFRDTFYIITERCDRTLKDMIGFAGYDGSLWVHPIARCVLQAVNYLHLSKMVHKDIHLGNVFSHFPRNEMGNDQPRAITFKVGDLGVSNFAAAIDPLFAAWISPPEALDPDQFGPMDHRIDIYHCGLLLLQVFHGHEITFTNDERLQGRPREMALELPPPFNFALEKALRRRVPFRTQTAAELWRDLNSPAD